MRFTEDDANYRQENDLLSSDIPTSGPSKRPRDETSSAEI